MGTLNKLLIGLISVVVVCGAVGVLHPGESAARGKFTDKFVTNKQLKDLILMLKDQVANLPESGPCAVPPTWSEVIPGNERFVPTTFVDGNGDPAAYCDRQTGNVWETVPSRASFRWGDVAGFPNAKRHCIDRSVGTNGQKGWRLASIAELASLVDTTSTSCSVDFKCIPDGSPFEIVPSASYWSASELAGNTSFAWFIVFRTGDVKSDIKGFGFKAWCVRGATDADVY